MAYRTSFKITTGDYQFNNISEFLMQLDTFGFHLGAALGDAHESGHVIESSLDQLAPNQFEITVVWANDMLFYEFLVSEVGRRATSRAVELGWDIALVEKQEISV